MRLERIVCSASFFFAFFSSSIIENIKEVITMKKFDWNHPLTRKDYAVLCGWSFGIVMAFYAIIAVINYWDKIKIWTRDKINWIKAKLPW